ncbi:hypothetical protein ACCO45_004731 [Purpureocillium lilacinum]|uniref:Uncharacterized protein n=1 Tax=Purpureocillium lilacinum TaxID=33203 RepID=A0ACC4DTE6_PURLI
MFGRGGWRRRWPRKQNTRWPNCDCDASATTFRATLHNSSGSFLIPPLCETGLFLENITPREC